MDCMSACCGLENLSVDVDIKQNWILLNKEDFTPYDVCVGSVNDCRIVLYKLGVTDFGVPCYPKELKIFLDRDVEVSTLKYILKKIPIINEHKFVKPVKPKLFSAFLTSDKDVLNKLYNVNLDEKVYISDIVSFSSEWRMYIKEGKIIRVCNYAGNPLLFPSITVMSAMARTLRGPCCAAIDVGIVGGTTCLVEVNDFYAIGNYGLLPEEYAQMLMLRWKQMVNK